jgi:magnesium chelatase accessory protein
MNAALAWERDGAAWPHRESSRFVEAAGLLWHVQDMGDGPIALLVHGTGSSTHSWRLLAPLLAARFRVVAVDLPGHAFTTRPAAESMSLPGMALALRGLLDALRMRPSYAIGHSAGAAILARLCLDGGMAPRGMASLNGALLPMSGFAGTFFSPAARLLASGALLPRLFAWHVSRGNAVERLVEGTGSRLDPDGLSHYRRLARTEAHAAAALAMMANWDLRPLERDLPRLAAPLLLVAAERDAAIAPVTALRVQRMVPGSQRVLVEHAGHLAHEERPHAVAELLLAHARSCGLPA